MLLRSLPPYPALPTGLIHAPDPCLSKELRSTALQKEQTSTRKPHALKPKTPGPKKEKKEGEKKNPKSI
jgi:hypothetical protein